MTAATPNALARGESAQGYLADPRNDGVLVYVNGAFVPRDEARVSIFDSGFVLGDGIWEGLRLVQGTIISLDAHLDRLYEGATSIALDIGMSRAELTQAVLDTLAKNDPSRLNRIIVTSAASPAVIRDRLRGKPYAVLPKPFDLTDLVAKVKEVVAQSR